MIRGHPPYVAIGEATRKAEARGMMALTLEPHERLPFHFVLCDRNCVSLVRVRRLKYRLYAVADILRSCKNDIEVLRAIAITPEIFRELWVRGPDRAWHRFLVLGDGIEEIEGWYADDDEDGEDDGPGEDGPGEDGPGSGGPGNEGRPPSPGNPPGACGGVAPVTEPADMQRAYS